MELKVERKTNIRKRALEIVKHIPLETIKSYSGEKIQEMKIILISSEKK
jgi:hypothetical protein